MSRIAAIAALAVTAGVSAPTPASAVNLCDYHGLPVDTKVCVVVDDYGPYWVSACVWVKTPVSEGAVGGTVFIRPAGVVVGC